MSSFHIIVRPSEGRLPASKIDIRGAEVLTYRLDSDSGAAGFSVSYEELSQKLSQIERLFIEPDGSFVWVSPDNTEQKLNGQITDDGKHVMFLELRGNCPFHSMEPVLAGLGWPTCRLLFQQLPEANLFDEEGIRLVLSAIQAGVATGRPME